MEPERKIEKWLRAFAKKRREQAGEPMELRPATRQRLQREIARQAGEKSRGGFFSGLFFGPRPRLVFAACFTALALGGWFLWRESTGPQPAQLSMNKLSYQETKPVPAAPETPPPAVMSPVVTSADKKVLEEKQSSIFPTTPPAQQPVVASANRSLAVPAAGTARERDRTESAPQQKELTITTTAASAPAGNSSLAFKNEVATGSLANADALAKDAEGAFPTISAPPNTNLIAGTVNSDANAQTLKSMSTLQTASAINASTNAALFDLAKAIGSATVSQVFNRLGSPTTRRSATGTTPTPAPVLDSFRVEQNGNNLKVIDGDGSVYTGSVQIAQQEPASDYSFAAAKNTPTGAPARAVKAAAPKPQNYFFRVAGTNRNLNANVVFSGNFVPFTNTQLTTGARAFGGVSAQGGAGGGGGGGGAIGGSDQAAALPVQAVLSNSEINGNVVIGNQKPIDVIATPAR